MHRVKAGLLLLLTGLAATAPPAGAALRTYGRRLALGPGEILVLTDPDRDRVAVFDVSGDAPRKRAEFGTRGDRPGRFRAPHGAAVSSRGSLVVADSFNHRLQSYQLQPLLDGRGPRLVRCWGSFGHGDAELDTPVSGLAILEGNDGRDLLFVADTRNHRVLAFDAAGRAAGPVIGGRGPEAGRLDWPSGLGLDRARSVLYVAEQGNRRVSAFDARSGAYLFAFGRAGDGSEGLQVPVDVAVDAGGDVWVVDQAARRVARFEVVADKQGRPRGVRTVSSWGRRGLAAGAWEYPQAIAVDGRRRVYVADRLDGRCQFFSEAGEFLGAFGGDVGAGGPEAYGPAPGPPPRFPVEACSNGGSYGVRVRASPEPLPLNEYFSLEVEVRTGCGEGDAATDVGLQVDAWMPEHAHGMNTVPQVSRRAAGAFLAEGLLFHMPGRWELYLDVVRGGVLERAQLELLLQ